MSTKVKSVCPYCGVGCGIVLEVQDNRVKKVAGDKEHPTNFGRLCTKGSTCTQAIAESGRMEYPYIRPDRASDPVKLGMEAALRATATQLRAILDEHGPDALSFYVSGQMSLESQYLINKLAKGFVRTNNIESNSRLCMASAGSGYKLSLGADGPPGSYQDMDQTNLFFVIGANMADCHPILFLRLMDRIKAGAKLIVVDPRRNTTADKADLYMQIAPGTDMALLNGLLHLIVKNGHTDPDFIARFTAGWEDMPMLLEDYPPDKVAAITGIPEADIRTAAQWIGEAGEWMSCWTMGLNQSTRGTWHTNAICNLHLATGAICRPGSGPFSLTGQPNAMGGREMGYMGPGLPGQRSVLVEADRRFMEQLWKVPEGTIRTEVGAGTVEMFEHMKAGRIKACWIICTNPVATVANRRNVIAGLQAAELVITQDAFYDTETNRYADMMLPGALWAEAEGVMINSERNLTLMQKAIDPPGEAMPDWQIIARIACEMGFADAFTYASAEEVFEEIKQAWNPKTGYDIRGASYVRLRETPLQWPIAPDGADNRNPIRYLNDGISQKLKVNEDGSRPRLVFATESGKGIFLARPNLLPAELPDDEYPFVLNTGRLQHQWHTMTKTGKIPTLNKLNPGPFVEIHPEDAATLGIAEQQPMEIRSRRGSAVLPVVITDRVRPGNCFAPFHWNDVFGERLAINDVTNDAIDPISFQPEFKYCAVALIPYADAAKLADDQPAMSGINTNAMNGAAASHMEGEVYMAQIDTLARMLGIDSTPAVPLEKHEKLYLSGFLTSLRENESRSIPGVPVLPPTAPLEPVKRYWLDGVLAGLFSRTQLPGAEGVATLAPPAASGTEAAAAEDNAASGTPVAIIWASQTGNAEGFASDCARKWEEAGHQVRLIAMSDIKPADLAHEALAVFITSTFGAGDPPDNGASFWQALQAADAPKLSSLRYSVLAFGDSNYDLFCGFGSSLDARLHELGAQKLLERVDCDTDYEEQAASWMDTMGKALEAGPAAAEETAVVVAHDRQNPFPASLIGSRLLNREGSEKEVRHHILSLHKSGLSYEAGDALGIWPTNCPELVQELIDTVQLEPSAPVNIKDYGEMPLAAALGKRLEIARITPSMLDFVYKRNGNQELGDLLKPDNKAELRKWLWGRQLPDLLQAFPITVTAEELVRELKPLQPRLYSISSSPKANPDEVHVTVSTVRYPFNGKQRKGVCSAFLADRATELDGEVPIFIQPAPHFRPPLDPEAPMIMVGPGTGVGPFRGFLQERRATGASGKNWLIFGEQRAEQDFYFQEELEELKQAGFLHRLDTAFSRDQQEKIYVQHRLEEHGAELWSWLQAGAHFYVCGDASHMAKAVDEALKRAIAQHGGMSAAEADAYVAEMAKTKRYARDVY
jgi:sulfite reductase (NADPH) flavoprotein alpha-component